MKIEGKNIVLTGASSGIGLEILNLLSTYKDIKIVAVARNTETIPLKEGVVFPFSADLSNKEGVNSLFDYCVSAFEDIDIFIANAGYAYLEKLDKPDWQHIENIFSLNTFSPIYSLQKLVEQNSDRQKYFVCISSAATMVPLPYYSLYCSTKAAISQFMNTYMYESANNMHVMTVYPVATRTSFFEKAANSTHPPVPFLTQSPVKVAKAVLRGIERNRRKVYPSILFRAFNCLASVFPFVFGVYSWREKRKVEKKLDL